MNKKNNKNYPFSNEVKKFKEEFKQLIDTMPDDDFMDMMSILMIESEDLNDDFWNYDEGWEDEAEKFYNHTNNTAINNLINDEDLPF